MSSKRKLFASIGSLVVVVGFAAGCGSSSHHTPELSRTADTKIYDDSRYMYMATPYKDLLRSEKRAVIKDAVGIIDENLRDIWPEEGGHEARVKALIENQDKVDEFVERSEQWINGNSATIAAAGLSPTDLVPSGFMVLVGGKFTANLKWGGGGSGTIAVVVVPTRVVRIDKTTAERETFTRFRIALSGIGIANVGMGAGGGAAFRAGLGAIWGPLDKPSDFEGVIGGVSGTLGIGVGNNVKFMGLKRSSEGLVDNVFATVMWQTGASSEAEFHFNAGMVLPLDRLIPRFGLEKTYESSDSEGEEASEAASSFAEIRSLERR